MSFRKRDFVGILVAVSLFGFSSSEVFAQGAQQPGQPQVSMVTLKAVKGPDGTTSVLTPKGFYAPLPGAGVNGNVAQIYIGSNGGYWYTDKTGQTVDLTPAVQQIRARMGNAATGQIPQNAPAPYGQNVTVNNPPAEQQSSGGGGSSALGTAAAAGMGAMAGAAMTGMFHNVPYGTPMYYGARGPYYYNNGERRTVEDLNSNQKAYLYNSHQNKKNQQIQRQDTAKQAYNTRQTNRQNAYNDRQANKQARYGNRQNAYNQHQSNIQQQQKWYQNQLSNNPQRRDQWKSQTNNPFVAQSHQRGSSGRTRDRSHSSGHSSLRDRASNRSGSINRSRGGGRFSGARGGGRRGGFRGR